MHTDYPQGAVALVEPGRAHRTFLEAVEPRYALLRISDARRLVKLGETASDFAPAGTDVITTTTDKDCKLPPWENHSDRPDYPDRHAMGEKEILLEFDPAYHIPGDHSVYADDGAKERETALTKWRGATLFIQGIIDDHGLDTTLIPLVKGVTPEERAKTYALFDRLDVTYGALYCNGYFNDGRGVRDDLLVRDAEIIDEEAKSELGEWSMFLIACQSPNVLARTPASVVAASGQIVGAKRGWRDDIVPSKQSPVTMQRHYADLERRVADALPGADVPQTAFDPGVGGELSGGVGPDTPDHASSGAGPDSDTGQ